MAVVRRAANVCVWGALSIAAGWGFSKIPGTSARGQVVAGPAAPSSDQAAPSTLPSPVAANIPLMPELPGSPTIALNSSAGATTRPVKDDLLGKLYSSLSSGIAFKPPAASHEAPVKREFDVVEFDWEARQWALTVSKLSFPHPMDLTTSGGAATQPAAAPAPPRDNPYATPAPKPPPPEEGVLEQYLAQLRLSYGLVDVLRCDKINAGQSGALDIGMLAIQYTLNGQRELKQVAIVERNPADYFRLELTSPGSDNPNSPLLLQAADTFSEMMDSVQILDQSPVRVEQDDRVLHTHALFGYWSEQIVDKALIPQRYLRIIRDGKEVGYVYATETAFKEGTTPAVKIATRMHIDDGASGSTETQSIMSSTVDFHHSHETWSTLFSIQSPKVAAENYSEIGASDYTPNVPRIVNGAVTLLPRYDLTVTGSLPGTGEEHRQIELDPWYLPQALEYLLPRILIPPDAKYPDGGKYLFYTWVPSQHEVMLLYCDVLVPDVYSFDGHSINAVAVRTHITLTGPVTTNYIDMTSGQYLGSQSDRVAADGKKTEEIIVPADAATLTRIWGRPNLSDPGDAARTPNG